MPWLAHYNPEIAHYNPEINWRTEEVQIMRCLDKCRKNEGQGDKQSWDGKNRR